MSERKKLYQELGLERCIRRLDALIAKGPGRGPADFNYGLGIRLAVGMAREIRDGVEVGSSTGVLIAEWIRNYGEASVESAIQTARDFLLKPGELKIALEKRLFENEMGE